MYFVNQNSVREAEPQGGLNIKGSVKGIYPYTVLLDG